MSVIKDMATEKDGVSFCPVRIGLMAGIALYFMFTVVDLFTTRHFLGHAKDWGEGLANLLGFGGGAVAAKNYTEGS